MTKRQAMAGWALMAALVLAPVARAQQATEQTEPAAKAGTLSDAQIEANVLSSLAAEPTLADQPISSSTTFGVVTLSGTVRDAASKEMASQRAATSLGVKKVVDELVVGDTAAAAPADEGASAMPSNVAAADQAAQQAQDAQQQTQAPAAAEQATEQPATPQQPQTPPQPSVAQQPPVPQQGAGYPPQSGPSGYAQQQGPVHYTGQAGGVQVTVPAEKHLQIRVNEGLNGKRNHQGDVFTGVLMNDVMAGGQVALPRGAEVTGHVVGAKAAGAIAGAGDLALELTGIAFGGQEYSINTHVWEHTGPNKSGQTAGNTIGMGALGAMVGAAAGGGPGAAIGAVAGGTAGMTASAASASAQARVPAESFVSFVLAEPVTVTTVSQDELNRLAGNAPPPAGYRPVERGPREYQVRPGMPYPYPYPYYSPRPYPY